MVDFQLLELIFSHWISSPRVTYASTARKTTHPPFLGPSPASYKDVFVTDSGHPETTWAKMNIRNNTRAPSFYKQQIGNLDKKTATA